jgi:hypothetical protein
MVVIWGQRMYGRVDRFAGSHVATRFFHLYYVPLIPLSSWLVLEEQADGRFLGIQTSLQLRSVMLAWLRVASVVALAVAGFNVLTRMDGRYAVDGEGFGWAITVGLAIALGFFAFFRLGKLSLAAKAQRTVYYDFTGKFVDVGLLGDGRAAIKARVAEETDRHLTKHAVSGYRTAAQTSWREIATRPDVRDVPLLRAALTRARLEWSEARGEQKRSLAQDHDKIFANLTAAAPELLARNHVEQFEMKS